VVHLGARYRLKLAGTSVLVRAQIGNVTNTFGWNVGGSGFFIPNGARRFSLSVAADI
jgi:iron complex outermembrane recepter protein